MPLLSRPTVHRLALLGVVSLVAGVLMAGMLLPVVGGVGVVARSAANRFESLPAELEEPPLPQVSRILAADGSPLATFYFQDRIAVSLRQVPRVMQKAIIAVEDVRFYEHHGVDMKGSLRALLHNGSAGTVRQGGSTLTQQYVKNVLIEKAEAAEDERGARAAHASTLARKFREARYALELEKRLSKREILERYLNIAYFGDGAYGIGTAAQHYFGIQVRRLSLAQSALLAGLVQSPEVYDPAVHPDAARTRRDTVLAQMLKYDFITQAQHDRAVSQPIELDLHKQGNGCEASAAPYFCDYVQHVIERSPVFGATAADRRKLLLRGGLTIRTTLQPKVQQAADAAVRKYVLPRDPSGVAGAEAVVEPGTGKVLAISVSRPYGQDAKKGQNTIDYAVDAKYGGGYGGQAGSTFKLFVLAAALKQGIPLGTTIYSPPKLTNLGGFTDCNGANHVYGEVNNAEAGEGGNYNLVTGTWFSVNTFYAQLEQRTGLCQPVTLAEAMGMRPSLGGHITPYPSFVLGAGGYSVLDLAGAYATVAAHGRYCPPVAITRVTTADGERLALPRHECSQVLEPGLADTITSILNGVLTRPGATAANVGEPGRPAAAKTGTAENNSASNFAGYVPQMAAAVWVGDPKSPNRSLNGSTIGGRSYGQVFGATIAGPIWHDTLQAALDGVPVEPLPAADPAYVRGLTKSIPYVNGLSVTDAMREIRAAGFRVTVAAGRVPSLFPAGSVAYTSPRGSAAPGSVVTVFVSNGTPPPPAHPRPTTTASPAPSPATASPAATAGPPTPQPTCTKKKHGRPHC